MTRFLALASVLLLGVTTVSADRGRGRRPHRPPPPVSLDGLRELTSACQDAFDGPTNEQRCMATISNSQTRSTPRSMVAACENGFDGDEAELSCLAVAVTSWQDPAALIAACENGFDGDANEQTCLDTLVGTRYEPTELVRYCEDSFDGDANELACLGQYR